MSELKLKPCPCCESDEVIHFKKTRNRGYVTCIACGMRTRGCGNYEHKDDLKWRERATIIWNTRTPMANIVKKLEELKNEDVCIETSCIECKEKYKNNSKKDCYEPMQKLVLDKAINIVKQEINKEN